MPVKERKLNGLGAATHLSDEFKFRETWHAVRFLPWVRKLIVNIAKIFVFVAVAGMLGGCCSQPKPQQVTYALSRNAIFNPSGSPVPLEDFARADWPATEGYDTLSDDTQFVEHFIDVQGRGWSNDDGYLYRRFDSARYGRSRR